MTSRRSRLKAVTNLPVRRKPGQLENFGEVSSEPQPAEKNFSSNLTSNDSELVKNINSENADSCYISQNYETEAPVLEKDFQVNTSNHNVTTYKHCLKNETDKSFNEISTEITFGENLISTSSEASNKSNEIIENLASDLQFANELKSEKHFHPSLILSSEKVKLHNQTDENNSKNHSVKIYNLNCNQVINSESGNIDFSNQEILEGDKHYTVLTTQNNIDVPTTNYTITTLTENPVISAENYVDSQNNTPTIEENFIRIEPAEFVIDISSFVNNGISQNSEFFCETDQLEPFTTTLTSLVSCKTVRNGDKTITNLDSCVSSSLLSENASQSLFVKPLDATTAKNVSVEENNVNKDCDSVALVKIKSEMVSSNLKTSQTTTNLEYVNVSSKKMVSTVRRKKCKSSDFTKKLADARRAFHKKYEKTKPDRSTLKMIDLIFYNPTTNPMESKLKPDKKEIVSYQEEMTKERLSEEKIDEPDAVECNSDMHCVEKTELENSNKMPVPQVKIGINGEIILDEKSLIIETTEAKKGREDLLNSIPVFEERGSKVSYYRGKSKKTRDWTDFETKRFYKALNTIGPDFSLMQKYFPKRSRLELKNKFKREERLNRSLIDKALNNPSEFDMTQLEKDLAVEKKAEEEEVEMRLCRAVKDKRVTRKPRIKSSVLSREMIESDGECENNNLNSVFTSETFLENEKLKKKNEMSFIYKKLLLKNSDNDLCKVSEISSQTSCLFKPNEHGVT